jgi:hypothetical protein
MSYQRGEAFSTLVSMKISPLVVVCGAGDVLPTDDTESASIATTAERRSRTLSGGFPIRGS